MRKNQLGAAIAVAGIAGLSLALTAVAQSPGYDDTPFLPGGKWRVHDSSRPQPRVVAAPADAPPSDAVVLFDGTDLSRWRSGGGEDAKWQVEGGYMEVNGTGKIVTRDTFGDCQLHVEFATPAEVKGESQGRGNSGVFFFDRYEVQVLDSYENPSYPDGQASALYGQYPPMVNSSRPPGEWQSYDIIFKAPRFEGGELVSPAVVTVFHNGIIVHHAREMVGATSHRNVGKYSPHGPAGPIALQDHGNPVRFRNVWVRPLEL